MDKDLTDLATHFDFGKNWASYAERVTEQEIVEATKSLARLLGSSISGQRFLDIGCGSGLHSLAALRLGAKSVVALDVDPISVKTTERLLSQYAPRGSDWSVEALSIFDLPGKKETTVELEESFQRPTQLNPETSLYDVVYSWGVLHHTGDLERAIHHAATAVAPGGRLVLALYRRTWLDWFWKIEKKWYTSASSAARRRACKAYITMLRIGMSLSRRSFHDHVANYKSSRGMSFEHDVIDWLGGWPYEPINSNEVNHILDPLGFKRQFESFKAPKLRLMKRPLGLFGSGCDEYVYTRKDQLS